MRSMEWVFAVLASLGLAATAAAFEPECSTCGSCQGMGLGAPACAAPFYGTPGCCECPPGPCDNAWEGYCERKACWQAIWHNVGTGVYGRWRGPCYAGSATCYSGCAVPGVVQPAPTPAQALPQPAVGPADTPSNPPVAPPPPAPAPVAEQAYWGWSMPWTR